MDILKFLYYISTLFESTAKGDSEIGFNGIQSNNFLLLNMTKK